MHDYDGKKYLTSEGLHEIPQNSSDGEHLEDEWQEYNKENNVKIEEETGDKLALQTEKIEQEKKKE
jgi:hypothetical protein